MGGNGSRLWLFSFVGVLFEESFYSSLTLIIIRGVEFSGSGRLVVALSLCTCLF